MGFFFFEKQNTFSFLKLLHKVFSYKLFITLFSNFNFSIIMDKSNTYSLFTQQQISLSNDLMLMSKSIISLASRFNLNFFFEDNSNIEAAAIYILIFVNHPIINQSFNKIYCFLSFLCLLFQKLNSLLHFMVLCQLLLNFLLLYNSSLPFFFNFPLRSPSFYYHFQHGVPYSFLIYFQKLINKIMIEEII